MAVEDKTCRPEPVHSLGLSHNADAISASWARCARIIDRDDQHRPHIATADDLVRGLTTVQPLLSLGGEELGRFCAVMCGAHYAALLATADGMIVKQCCHGDDADQFRSCGTIPGAVWTEQLEGTNAIGTCLVEQVPISVHRDQHFRREYANMSCFAAPIFDPNSQLMAILAVASANPNLSEESYSLAHALTADCAHVLDERQFRAHYRHLWTIALVQHGHEASVSLLAVDRDQRVLAANREACSIFALDLGEVGQGFDLWDLFERPRFPIDAAGGPDVCAKLECRRTSQIWQAIITPPHVGGIFHGAPDALQDTCPRRGLFHSWSTVAEAKPARGGLPPKVRGQVEQYIEDHLPELIELRALSRIAGFSVFHFAHAFKQSTGLSPHKYILERRIARASELLAQTDTPLSTIALRTGFADESHFARHFRRHTGKKPSVVRWENRSNNTATAV